jgi:hypothetical protein
MENSIAIILLVAVLWLGWETRRTRAAIDAHAKRIEALRDSISTKSGSR